MKKQSYPSGLGITPRSMPHDEARRISITKAYHPASEKVCSRTSHLGSCITPPT
jgi:hypothetical protein